MIKLFLTDLDGSLTDGTYTVHSHREGIAKRFNTRDFHGMFNLYKADVTCAVVTLSRGLVITKQVDRLPFPMQVYSEVKNKDALIFQKFVASGICEWEEIAFIGDDENDIPLLKKVGVAACPADAEPSVIHIIEQRKDAYIMNRRGGDACVREFANMILKMV